MRDASTEPAKVPPSGRFARTMRAWPPTASRPHRDLERRPRAATSSAARACGRAGAGAASRAPPQAMRDDGAPPARPARDRRARPGPDAPSPRARLPPGRWAPLTYGERRFFDWGGWLAVRPMEELPHWRVIMRRERDARRLARGRRRARRRRSRKCAPSCANAARSATATTRGDADPGRRLPRAQGQRARAALPVADRRSDGDAPRAVRAGLRPDRSCRARAELIRESNDAEADDFLLTKMVAWDGLPS